MAHDDGRSRSENMAAIEAALLRIIILRRQPRYRERLAAGTGLDGRVTTMRLLRAIHDLTAAGDPPSIRDVAARLLMEQSNTSRAVDHSVEQGLVVKQQSMRDARSAELRLTERGQQAIDELDARREAVMDELMQQWDDADLDSLAEMLERLSSDYENFS